MKKSLYLFLFIVFGVFACNTKKTVKLALVTFITHPLFNTIENSFKTQLKNELGQDIKYEIVENNAQGNIDNLPFISQQVAVSKPDVIVAISTPVTQSILRAVDNLQPVVYTFVSDTTNLGDALQTENVTGVSDVINYQANINLIKTIYGDSVIIGVLYNPNEANSMKGIQELNNILLKEPKLKILYSAVNSEADIALATVGLLKQVDVILSIGDNTVGAALSVVASEASKKMKAVFAIDEGSIRAQNAVGGISVDYEKLGAETAKVVATIIKSGVAPKNIPKIMLTGNKLLLNKKALDRLNIQIPDSVLKGAELIDK